MNPFEEYKTEEPYDFKEGIKPIHLTSILFVVCQFIRLIVSNILFPVVEPTGIEIPSMIITVIFAIIIMYFMYKGKKWPVYLSLAGVIFLTFSLIDITKFWGADNTTNIAIIFSWTMYIIETSLICYLLFYPPCQEFYKQMKLKNY